MKHFIFLFSAIISLPAISQNSLQFLSATTGAACNDILYYNNFIYSGTGNTLQVFNLNANGTPNQKVFEYRFTSLIDDMEMKGNKLFIAANHAGLSMWDAANPGTPVLLDEYIPDSLNEAAYHIAFYGDSIFVAYKTKMVLFKDNGTSLQQLQKFAYQSGNGIVRGCGIKGNILAYTTSMGTNPTKGVTLWNITTMQFISFYHQNYCDPETVIFGQNNNLLHVLGGTASYVNPFDANGLFYSLDITNPTTPLEVFRDTIPGIIGLAICQPMNADNVNDTIFVSTQAALDTNYNIFQDTAAGMIYVYDATVPSNIQFLTTINGGLWNFDCDVVGNLVYVASEWYGIKTLDITNIHNDISLGYKATGGWNLGSDKFGNTLMVGNEGYGFKKYDVSNLQNPIYQTSNRDPGFCMNLRYSSNGNLLYGFYMTYDRFRVMDPANNYNVVGSIPTVVGSSDPWVYGTKIASLDLPSIGNKTLFITDVSNPAAPFVDSMIIMNDVKDILVNKTGKLFVVRQDTLSVYDLNNNLTKLLSITVPNNFWNDFIAIAEYKDTVYAYISGLINSGVYKYYYNGSNQLTQIGYFNSINVAYTGNLMLAVDSFNLYLSDINKGLFAYNKNTLTQTGYNRDGMEFTVNFLWGPQELVCKDNLIFLVEYFGQTTILSGDSDLMLNVPHFENEFTNQLNIFPIPADEELTIALFGNNSTSFIEILDLEGRIIFQGKSNSELEKINTLHYSDGMYFVRISDGGKLRSGKFLVQH